MDRAGLRDAFAALAVASLCWLGPWLASSSTSKVTLNLGPNDSDYTIGFREDWERDGVTPFRWCGPQAEVRLPLNLRGSGFLLRARVRRHFVEPAHVRLGVQGRTIAAFDLAADPHVPYRILEFPLPTLDAPGDFRLSIAAPSENSRPLGIAFDWLEIERRNEPATVSLLGSASWRLALVALATLLALRWSRSGFAGSFAAAGLVALVASIGAVADPLACDRILAEGAVAYAATALLAAAIVRHQRWPGWVAGAVMLAAAVRLATLLHPLFYYPDVRVHALFVWQLARRGFADFLRDFTTNQYRYSLGLQRVGDHWYAFPYPPLFYVLARGFLWLTKTRADFIQSASIAVSVCASVINALETLLVFAIARRISKSPGAGMVAAFVHALLPLFLIRLSLAYFPAIAGHFVDAAFAAALVLGFDRWRERRFFGVVSVAVALSLLVYTQGLLNLAVFLPLFLVALVAVGADATVRRRAMVLVAAVALGGALSVVVFYARYVPSLMQMHRGEAPAGEEILLDLLEKRQTASPVPDDEVDPYTGPAADPLRGLRKAVWRAFVFYGPFALLVLAGLVLLIAETAGWLRALILGWAATYVVLNLASGGLPGPNLVRYNKDLEIVAPLFCCAIAVAIVRARSWRPWAGVLVGSAWFAYAAWRGYGALVSRFVLER